MTGLQAIAEPAEAIFLTLVISTSSMTKLNDRFASDR